MNQLIQRNKIPPLRQVRYCCRELKERGGAGRVKVTGIRAEESPRRAKRSVVEDDIKGGGKFVHVIKRWTTADVWQYIHENNLPYCSLYDEGFTRIGCVLCPFQSEAQTLRDIARFPAIVEYYRRACGKSFEKWHDQLSKRFEDGDALFRWWIDQRHGRAIAQDCNSIPLFSEDDGSIL